MIMRIITMLALSVLVLLSSAGAAEAAVVECPPGAGTMGPRCGCYVVDGQRAVRAGWQDHRRKRSSFHDARPGEDDRRGQPHHLEGQRGRARMDFPCRLPLPEHQPAGPPADTRHDAMRVHDNRTGLAAGDRAFPRMPVEVGRHHVFYMTPSERLRGLPF